MTPNPNNHHTTLEPWHCNRPPVTVELARSGTDESDLYTSLAWNWAMPIAGQFCPVCCNPLLASDRWFKRADGLEVNQRLTECSECDYRRME